MGLYDVKWKKYPQNTKFEYVFSYVKQYVKGEENT